MSVKLIGPDGSEVAPSGDAAARERYVMERAEFLARAHHAAMGPAMRVEQANVVVKGWDSLPEPTQRIMVAVMRDLIDSGVLK